MAISAGYFPDTYKKALMIFIPKGTASQYQIQNYRPISLLDIQSKLLDKILTNRLKTHLDRHNIHNSRQHGFRAFRGTDTALGIFYEQICNHFSNRETIDVVLRDVSKAFDKVWHDGLKFKILNINLHNCFTRTIANYLDDRTASIQIGNTIGPSFNLLSGVPQGACLSPTLYNLFTHDMPEPLPWTNYIAFADDITQITSGRHPPRYASQLTAHAIQQVNNFENQWKIQTNISKFTVFPISRNKTVAINTLDGQNTIQYSNQGKILGLNITKIGIGKQVGIRKAIARKNLAQLYRFKNLKPSNKLKLYNALVRSALIYPIVPLNTLSKTSMIELQRIQNLGLRFITNTNILDFVSSEDLHQQVNLKPINIIIHNQAADIWTKIRQHLPLEYNDLIANVGPRQAHYRFNSSRTLAESPAPDPIYR